MILDVQKEKWTVSSLGFTARTDNQPLVTNAKGTCTTETSTSGDLYLLSLQVPMVSNINFLPTIYIDCQEIWF